MTHDLLRDLQKAASHSASSIIKRCQATFLNKRITQVLAALEKWKALVTYMK